MLEPDIQVSGDPLSNRVGFDLRPFKERFSCNCLGCASDDIFGTVNGESGCTTVLNNAPKDQAFVATLDAVHETFSRNHLKDFREKALPWIDSILILGILAADVYLAAKIG